jgi:parvulin-like peptidyl-prolyl isomerase
MAKRGAGETKKHLVRAQRERQQRRMILIGAITVAVLLVVVLAYGIYDTTFVQPFHTVAVVNGEAITSGEFGGRVRLIQRELLSQLSSYVQMESFFGSDPGVLQELRNLEVQLQTQLANPELIGRDVLESMILQRLLMAEALSQGVSVSEQQLQVEVQRNFNFYPEGTPTSVPTSPPEPTSTIDPTSVAASTTLPSASPGPNPTTGPTSTPQATPTAYTFEIYESNYDAFIGSLSDFRIREEDFLAFLEIGLLEENMRANFIADIDREQEQVFVRVILAESEEVATQILERLVAGELWADLALEFSLDVTTQAAGGEVGWSTLSDLLRKYGQPGLAAFASQEDSIVGPLPAEGQGFYLFQIDERGERPISEEAYQVAFDQAFDAWLQGLRNEADVTIAEDWQSYLPAAVPVNF